ncbi:MAG: FkbM family methyltransferase [Dokdonia sp.]|jgi:FkbM family methyltransferase
MRLKKVVKNKVKATILKIWPDLHVAKSTGHSNRLESLYSSLSYAQEGEDLLLQRIFEGRSNGFYIDVGAHHPFRFSNTFLLYQQGWRGINIDAMPGSMKLFNEHRPEDINLEIGVSATGKELLYYMFNEPALNSFSKEEAYSKVKKGVYEIESTKTIPTKRLEDIIKEHLHDERKIDLLSIDAEGYDLEVLHSLNLEKSQPSIIVIEETGNKSIHQIQSESSIYTYLTSNNYRFIAKTFNSLFFQLTQ